MTQRFHTFTEIEYVIALISIICNIIEQEPNPYLLPFCEMYAPKKSLLIIIISGHNKLKGGVGMGVVGSHPTLVAAVLHA